MAVLPETWVTLAATGPLSFDLLSVKANKNHDEFFNLTLLRRSNSTEKLLLSTTCELLPGSQNDVKKEKGLFIGKLKNNSKMVFMWKLI